LERAEIAKLKRDLYCGREPPLPAALLGPTSIRSRTPSKLKALLRKAAERTVDGLWAAIGCIIDLFAPDVGRNYMIGHRLSYDFSRREGEKDRWERVAALSSGARVGSGVR
jgi:hypothetical protein